MIDADLAQAFDFMSKAVASLSDTAPLMSEIGLIGTSAAKDRIAKSKENARGVAWKPWKETTALHRLQKGSAALGLLYDSGNLLRSINAKQGPNTVEIGSSADYAEFLQEGTKNMAARPFLGWSDADMDNISRAFNAWVDRSIS